ncbi:putative transporter of the NRAMP family [Mucidula mucida]|nr:putative transporter of the NRAMP family [Mucidula mucida]
MSTERAKRTALLVLHHAKKHTGVGIVCAVAYFDPGNWGVDLQAGSQFGYRLLFVVLLAGIFAIFFQVSASKLGCVTGLDLASHCRLLLYNRPKHKLLYRWLLMYPLYALSEVAIIATDLAELLGSAIALCMLFPRLQLWHGVVITAFDVIFILALGDPLRGRPVKLFEFLIAALVLAVLVCMCIVISRVDVQWDDAFLGFVPSKYIFQSGGLYISVGIIGATVMPHSLFLGSALATQDRVSSKPLPAENDTDNMSDSSSEKLAKPSVCQRIGRQMLTSVTSAFASPPPSSYSTTVTRHGDRENNTLSFVSAHIYHGIVDIVSSLLGFAVLINSLILILAGSVFFFNDVNRDGAASLFDAYDLIRDLVGQSAATLFAVALLAAGQSSSIIATVAGQAVSEGFLQWRVSPVVRRLATRLIALIPALAVAVAIGRSGIDTLLVASQVVLSITLPFITLPLIWLTSKFSGVMRVRGPDDAEGGQTWVDFSNGYVVIIISGIIWMVVLTANVYVLVELGRGAS